MSKDAVALAKQLLKLNAKLYNSDTCDDDCLVFEQVALALAHAVLEAEERRAKA